MEYKLKEIGTVITGGTPKTKNEEYYSKKDYLFIGPSDIKNNKYIRDSEKYVSEKAYDDYKNKFINENSIMIDCIGSDMGNVAISTQKILTNQQINSITNIDETKFNVEYVYYVLSTMKKYFHQIGTNGSTMPIINKTMFEEIEINIPNKKIQDKVVKVLSVLDKKIELNNQINNNLHKLSDELYKGWFINYNYPTFNGKLKESSLGLIPEDWKVEKLENVAECQNGYAFYKDGYDEDGIMVIDLGNINLNSTFIYTNADKYIMPNRVETDKFKKYRVYKNDLIMVMTDRKATMELLGKTGKIFEDKEFLLNQRMYRIRSKINTNYLYTVLNNDIVLSKLKSKALGSVQKYVNTGHINELDILIGTDEIMEKFSGLVDPIYAEIENRTIENTRLEKLRDSLLPKLMNGEIDLDKIEIWSDIL